MVTEDKSLFTLSNAGTKRNCSLTAVLAPINLKLIQFEIGKPFSNTGLTSMVSYFVTRYIVNFFKIEIIVLCYQNCSDVLWEKIILVIEKNFWNSRLKAENLKNVWDH